MNPTTASSESPVQLFKKFVFSPFLTRNFTSNQDQLEYIAQEIYNWARTNGAEYISFFAHPFRYETLQKHASFLSLKFIKENMTSTIGSEKLKFAHIWKHEFDANSIPNGALRSSHQSRANLIWDHEAELFIRKLNKVMYIPSFIVSPQGHPLDDRLHFKKAEKMLLNQLGNLLQRFHINFGQIVFTTSLKQQFFIVPKEFVDKRLDLKFAQRLLIGTNGFEIPSYETYMKKIPQKIQMALKQAEHQLLEIGVPFKVRHCLGGLNQFKIQTQIQNVSASIYHNVLMIKILQETCQRHGFHAIFHEKPFSNINGSGKQINWSLSYLDQTQKTINLYDLKSKHKDLLILLILITLKGIQQNEKLLIASTMTPGNQVRLSQKQALLPAMSVYLGEQLSHMIEGLQMPEEVNLKKRFDFLLKDQFQQAADRNRTSAIAFSENIFEFTLPGSSQNCVFSLTIIMASITAQIQKTLKKIEEGLKIEQIISEYRQSTRKIRYEGNCYSEEWKKQAEKRGLYYPKQTFVDRINYLSESRKLLTESGIFTNKEIEARQKVMIQDYISTVQIEKDCILKIISTNIIPRSYAFISTFPRQLHLKNIQNRMKTFDKLLENLMGKTQTLQKTSIYQENSTLAYQIRQQIFELSKLADKIVEMLPESQSFPDIMKVL